MHNRELFKHYRQLVEDLANQPRNGEVWLADLTSITEKFEKDAAELHPGSAVLLCEELCQQFEHEAVRATNAHRRDVLLGTVKRFEAMSFPPTRE